MYNHLIVPLDFHKNHSNGERNSTQLFSQVVLAGVWLGRICMFSPMDQCQLVGNWFRPIACVLPAHASVSCSTRLKKELIESLSGASHLHHSIIELTIFATIDEFLVLDRQRIGIVFQNGRYIAKFSHRRDLKYLRLFKTEKMCYWHIPNLTSAICWAPRTWIKDMKLVVDQ